MKHTENELIEKSYNYKKRFLELFTRIGFGHVTSAFSWADIATVLYNEILNNNDSITSTTKKDYVVVSKGHGVGILFPVFEDLGYISKEELDNSISIGGSTTLLRKLYEPGFDFYGGSLGIGFGFAAGIAKAIKLSNSSQKVFCVIGDAECYEGSIWETINFSSHQELNNLIVVVDRNELGCSNFTERMQKLEPFAEKWKAFNWEVNEINGHNMSEIYTAFCKAIESKTNKPKCIIAHTIKGKGLDYLVGNPLMHGYMPKGNDIKKSFDELKK